MARAGLTPDRLALAGAEIADAEGLAAATLTAIARRFDVRVASLYAHVQGSDDLRTRITLLALEEMADRGDVALAGRSGKDALVALGGVYRDYAHQHPGRYAAARLRLDPEAAGASAGRRHAEMSRAVLRGYDLNGDDQTHAVRLLGSVFHGFSSLETDGAFAHSEPDSAVSWVRILDSLDLLLRTWGQKGSRP